MELVPDLADAVPAPTDGGRTYSFHMRPGVRFADGAPVRASDAAASLRRLFRVARPDGRQLLRRDRRRGRLPAKPATCTLPGVVADDAAGTLTIRLTARIPSFLLKLALPHASVLPADAPDHDVGTEPMPGTGPYRDRRYDPARTACGWSAIPLFQPWSADAQPTG